MVALLAIVAGKFAFRQKDVANEKAAAARAAEKRTSEVGSQANVSLARHLIEASNYFQALARLAQALRLNPKSGPAAASASSILAQTGFPLPVARLRGDAAIFSAAFSPDGQRIVTASRDKTARLWDASSGKAIGLPMQHDDTVNSAAFSPDGQRIVTASRDKTARLWDAASGKAIGLPMQHDGVVISAAFSPDGQRIVTASGTRRHVFGRPQAAKRSACRCSMMTRLLQRRLVRTANG